MARTAIALMVLIGASPVIIHGTERSSAVRAEFHRSNPCPANGKTRGRCPGYVVDHIEPLCAGGWDAVENMQWQTVAEAKDKDRSEHAKCRTLRRLRRENAKPIMPRD